MAAVTNPNGIGSGWVKALWITKKPVAEMALNYNPAVYEAIHSTYEDNFRLQERRELHPDPELDCGSGAAPGLDPGIVGAPGWHVLSELGPGAPRQTLSGCDLRRLATAVDLD